MRNYIINNRIIIILQKETINTFNIYQIDKYISYSNLLYFHCLSFNK